MLTGKVVPKLSMPTRPFCLLRAASSWKISFSQINCIFIFRNRHTQKKIETTKTVIFYFQPNTDGIKMKSASYNSQIIKIKSAYYLETKIVTIFSKQLDHKWTYLSELQNSPPTLSTNKVNPDLVNHILVLVISKHYRCFSIHAHLKDGLHQAQEF